MFGSEPIIAWRCWDVERHADTVKDWSTFIQALAQAHDHRPGNPYRELLRPRLGAVGYGSIPWPAREPMIARCDYAGCKRPPGKAHPCGIWALKDEARLREALQGYAHPGIAYGRVKLWGRYIEFEKGYRAQYAYPLDLTLVEGEPEWAAELAHDYGIPAVVGELPKGVMMRRAPAGPTAFQPMPALLAPTAMIFHGATYLSASAIGQYWGVASV